MSLNSWKQEWFEEEVRELSRLAKIASVFWLIGAYLPFFLCLCFVIGTWQSGVFFVLSFQLSILSILLFIGFFCQAQLNYGVFPKFDRFAKRMTFPLFLFYRIITSFLNNVFLSLSTIIIFIFTSLLKVGAIALGIFILIGLFGLLLFGFRQVF